MIATETTPGVSYVWVEVYPITLPEDTKDHGAVRTVGWPDTSTLDAQVRGAQPSMGMLMRKADWDRRFDP